MPHRTVCIALDCAQCALYLYVVTSIPDQLLAAMRARGWSFRRLLDESKLDMALSSLQRKLHGQVPLYEDEIQTLVNVLDTAIAIVPADAPRRKRAS